MEKVLVDIEVVKGILNAYKRAGKTQSRIYGIILGNKKDNIYHVTDAIYGYIFEDEDEKTHKKKFTRLNDENLKSILNSLHQKFNLSNDNQRVTSIKLKNKENKEKENIFKTYDTQMILGGFATDKQLFSDLHNLYSTIELITDNVFKNINSILLLVDPNHKDEKEIKFGIKSYEWSFKNIRSNNNNNRLLFFKELDNDIIQHIHNVEILQNVKSKCLWDKIYNLNIDKNDKRNINELLLDLKDNQDEIFIHGENNIEFIKNKIKECILYLNIFEKILENDDNKDKDYVKVVNEDDYNKISYILSQMEPILTDNEIIKGINNDIDAKYDISSLTQLLEVQLTLSDKIRELIK